MLIVFLMKLSIKKQKVIIVIGEFSLTVRSIQKRLSFAISILKVIENYNRLKAVINIHIFRGLLFAKELALIVSISRIRSLNSSLSLISFYALMINRINWLYV